MNKPDQNFLIWLIAFAVDGEQISRDQLLG
jgi:hypothetical protein